MTSLARVDAEAATATNTVAVPLGDVDIEVLPVRDWRNSGLRALRDGDFDTWAEKCLTDAGRAAWLEADPTIGEIEDFFTAWKDSTGQDPGKSVASSRSSRSTARR